MPITRTYRTIGFSVPPGIATEIDTQAKKLQLTKSEFFRDMFRAWQEKSNRDRIFESMITKAIAESEEEKRTNPKTPETLLAEFQKLSEAGRREAEALGIDVRDEETLNDMVYAEREARRRER